MKNKFLSMLLFFVFCIFTFQSNFVYCANDNSVSSNDNINIYSDAGILIDFKTGNVLYSKNGNERRYPASTTKILTAILAIEKCNLDDIVTVSKSAVSSIPSGYSTAYLSADEEISVRDLITVFLVHSANDAGYVLAEHISGSIDAFADLMNSKAKEIGCIDTHFTNPSGIHDENHYTTASDLALIARYCMQNATFRSIVSKKTCTISSTNKFGERSYINTNDLLNPSSKYYLEECVGIKTGYTSQAKNCLISACSKNGLGLICVILGANPINNSESSRYIDSINLFKYGYSNYSLKTLIDKGDVVETIKISNGSDETKSLDLIVEDSISALSNNSAVVSEPKIVLKGNLSAPIAKNSIIGTISYTIDDTTYTQNLLASHDVEQSNYTVYILGFVFIFLVIIIILTIIIIMKFKKSKYDF